MTQRRNVILDVRNGKVGTVHSAASRSGVIAMTKTLTLEWAKYGIRINDVVPSKMIGSGIAGYPEAAWRRRVDQSWRNPAGR